MRTRPLAGLAILVLLTIYGALPCLALTSATVPPMHEAMPMPDAGAAAHDRGAPSDGCDGNAETAILLCAAPTAFAPLSTSPVMPTLGVTAASVDAGTVIAPSDVTMLPLRSVAAPPGRATPVFLLHATLLI